MLAIRLQRIGKKGQPSYRLVVAERRSKLIAPPTEDLGSYNPFTKQANFKAERVNHWLKAGAQATVTVHNLLVKTGVVTAPKKRVYMKKAVAAAKEEASVSASSDTKVVEDKEATADKPAVAEAPAEAPKEG